MRKITLINVRKVLLISFLLDLLFISVSSSASAQDTPEEGADWRPPTEISSGVLNDASAPANSRSPTLAADPWGTVHAIWVTDLDSSDQVANNSLHYSSWDGNTWSTPIDIYLEDSGGLWQPKMVADTDGWLHLTWTRSGNLYYSRAYVDDAGQTNGWSEPYSPSGLKASNASLAVDSSNNIHVVFCTNRAEGYLAYQRTDGIDRWTNPVELASTDGCWTRIAVDGSDRLHVVYSDQAESGDGSAAYYLQSTSLGSSWSSPVTVDDGGTGYVNQLGPSWINVAAIGLDEVHIVWQGAPAGQIWHQWSENGGVSWSAPLHLFPDHHGLTEPVALAADSENTLHMVTSGWLETGEKPNGPFYTKWEDGTWDSLSKITDRSDWDAEGPDMVIAGGYMLIVSWRHQEADTNQAWTYILPLDAPAIIHQPRFIQASENNAISQSQHPLNEQESIFDPASYQNSGSKPFSDDPDNDLSFDPMTTAVLIVAIFLVLTIVAGRYMSKRSLLE